ncbi:trichohyalin-like [Bolinopsis microptera]|uniref:trichohyalin-like n=1 Tax=Bolinopsis microptera TaxID=2820187 RepID=UPI003078C76D
MNQLYSKTKSSQKRKKKKVKKAPSVNVAPGDESNTEKERLRVGFVDKNVFDQDLVRHVKEEEEKLKLLRKLNLKESRIVANKSVIEREEEHLRSFLENTSREVYENDEEQRIDELMKTKAAVLEDQNPAFRDENENEERTVMNRAEENEPSELHAEYVRNMNREEERLRVGFVDKNVVDQDLVRHVKEEEEKLKLLRKLNLKESRIVANESVIEKEEEHLRSILENTSREVYENDEEQRIDELMKTKAAILEDQSPAFRDVNEDEERTVMNRAEESETSALHAEYVRNMNTEEERLTVGFVDKNVVDQDLVRHVKEEEEKLKMLRKLKQSRIVATESVIEKEEEHLRSFLQNTSREVYENDEEQRIDELMKTRAVVLEDQNPAFRDENEDEERTVMNRAEENEPSELHAEYARNMNTEEERLIVGFVDKNIVDQDLARQVKEEEEKLKMLRKLNLKESRIIANESIIEKEEEYLRSILENTSREVYENDEEQRIDELIKTRAAEIIPEVVEASIEYQDENIKLDRAHTVRTTLEGETKHDSNIRGIMNWYDGKKRNDANEDKITRQIEDARLRDNIAKHATFQKRESELILKQNTRKNLAAVDNTKGPNKGKLHFRTAGGVINFVMNESGKFAAQNIVHKLSKDHNFIHQKNEHIQNSDCVLQNNVVEWALNMDSDYVNLRLNVIDCNSFNDATGTKTHNDRNDCTVVNLTRKHFIPTDASVGREANKHIRSKDSLVENFKSHDLRLVSRYHNHVRGHHLCPEGVFVQRAHKMQFPLPNTTDLRNSCTYFIPPSNSLINRSKGANISQGCVITGKDMFWDLCDNGNIVQKALRHSLALTGSQDRQNRQYSIPLSGSQDENHPVYFIPDNKLINRATIRPIPKAGLGDLRNNTRHNNHRKKTYSPWKRSKFSISSEGSLERKQKFGRFGDAAWKPCDNSYEIFDGLSIDEDYLNELDEEDV